jgi:hypothetical protein
MQILHYLPTENQLILDNATAQAVVDLLVEPFGTLKEAKAFWEAYPSTIVILNINDELKKVLGTLDNINRHFIEQAETTPEFIEMLPNNYQLSLTLTSDYGNGFYLVKPCEMQLTQENISHE